MGDTGSSLLGLLAGGLSMWGAREGVFPFWVALLVFSPFIVDATVTLLRRLGRGERVWQAHKSHYYQRLVQSGWGHRKTVLYEYVLMLACGLSALLAQQLNLQGQVALILFWCLVYRPADDRCSPYGAEDKIMMRLLGKSAEPLHGFSARPVDDSFGLVGLLLAAF